MFTKFLIPLLFFISSNATEHDHALMLHITQDPGILFDSPKFRAIIFTKDNDSKSDLTSVWHFPNKHETALLSGEVLLNVYLTVSNILRFKLRKVFVSEIKSGWGSFISSLSNICIPTNTDRVIITDLKYESSREGNKHYDLHISVYCNLFKPIMDAVRETFPSNESWNAYEVDHSDLKDSEIKDIQDTLNGDRSQRDLDSMLRGLSQENILKKLKMISYQASNFQRERWDKHLKSQNIENCSKLVL